MVGVRPRCAPLTWPEGWRRPRLAHVFTATRLAVLALWRVASPVMTAGDDAAGAVRLRGHGEEEAAQMTGRSMPRVIDPVTLGVGDIFERAAQFDRW